MNVLELEPLRNVGVAMSEATLQTLAYDLGIEKMVRNMTEAEKAQLRYIQIMRSSTEWQTDMGRTLITPANALRVMRQQFVQLGRAIGRVFIPIVMKLMPYVIAMTQLLIGFANKLAKALGFEIKDINYSGLEDISAGVTEIGDSADKTADKLNTMLAPFDDLNVVQNQAKNASSGLGGIGGDLGVELPEYDALANLNEKFAEGVEKAKKNLKSLLPIVKTIGAILVGMWVVKGITTFIVKTATVLNAFKDLKTILFGSKGVATALSGAGEVSKSTKSFTLPKFSTVLKGLAELATIVGATILFVEAVGLFMKIPGVKQTATDGIDLLKTVFNGLFSIAIPLTLMTTGVALISKIPYTTVVSGFGGIATIIGGMTALMTAIGLILGNDLLKKFNSGGVEILKTTFNGLYDVFIPLTLISGAVAGLGAVMTATGGTGYLAILAGLGALAEIIAGVGIVLSAVGLLYEIPGLTKFLDNGVDLLTKIGSAIGGFFGGIAGGIAGGVIEGLSESLPKLGTNLATFMINAKPFFDGINMVSKDATEGVKNLAESILTLTKNDIIEGLTGWFAGDTSLEEFGEELKLFAPKFADFTTSIAGIKDEDLEKAPKVAKALATMIDVSKDIPNQGKSVVSFFVGDNKLSTFGTELSKFAPKFAKYINKIATIKDEGLAISDKVFTALAKIISVSKDIPNQGASVVAFFVGDNKLSTFGTELSKFAPSFLSYYNEIKKVGNDVEDKTKKVFNSVKTINDVEIDKKGGLFSGTVSLSDFGKDLKGFGSNFKSYYDTVKNIKIDTINSVTNALSALVSNYKAIKDNKLTDTVKSFGTALQSSATNIKSYFSTELSYSSGWSIGNSFGSGIGDAIKSAMKSKIGTTIKVKDGYDTLKSFTISAYASGGYPISGELFFANENGVPEMVGRIGNQTAVANNDQITTSITNALMSALSQHDFGGGKSPTTIYIGNKKVYEGYGDYVADENDRYGTNMIKI